MALLTSLQTTPVPEIEEIVPAARTLLIRFRPEKLTAAVLASDTSHQERSAKLPRSERRIEIPVRYDGEDLDDVAQLTDLSVKDVIRRHTESEFTVAFCGFAPGFAYLMGGDPALYVPRRRKPRTHIPAGSVAIAGAFSGGWQLIGTTSMRMWDSARSPAVLLQPGNRVRLVNVDQALTIPDYPTSVSDQPSVPADESRPQFKVLTAPFPALFQDLGRCDQASQGISASGALDQSALRAANRIVGNPADTPCLGIIFGGFSFETIARVVVIGCAGAPCSITIQDARGYTKTATNQEPIALESGDVVRFGHPQTGLRCYLAVRSGFEVNRMLDSAATDTSAGLGPKPVTAGAVLALKGSRQGLVSVSLHEAPAVNLPAAHDVVVLDTVLGPRTDWFTKKGLEIFTQQHWQVTAESSRVGIRLFGDVPIERQDNVELPSGDWCYSGSPQPISYRSSTHGRLHSNRECG